MRPQSILSCEWIVLAKTFVNKDDIKKRIIELENATGQADFWADKNRAQAVIKEIQVLKAEAEGGSVYDNGDAVVTIFSGAGGDDAEDFSAMLFNMYRKYFENKGWALTILHQNNNDQPSKHWEMLSKSGARDA